MKRKTKGMGFTPLARARRLEAIAEAINTSGTGYRAVTLFFLWLPEGVTSCHNGSMVGRNVTAYRSIIYDDFGCGAMPHVGP